MFGDKREEKEAFSQDPGPQGLPDKTTERTTWQSCVPLRSARRDGQVYGAQCMERLVGPKSPFGKP